MSEKTYKVGTLTYTLRALCVMFLWMLGGAVCGFYRGLPWFGMRYGGCAVGVRACGIDIE